MNNVLTNDGDAYTLGGKLYGRVNSQETICKQLRRLKEIKDHLKIENQSYVSMRGIVKVRWNLEFHDYEKLQKRFPVMDVDVPLEV